MTRDSFLGFFWRRRFFKGVFRIGFLVEFWRAVTDDQWLREPPGGLAGIL